MNIPYHRLITFSFIVIFSIFAATEIVKGQNKQSVSWIGLTFTLNECRYAGGIVTCYFVVTSHGQDRHIEKTWSMSGTSWNITDDLGNTFPVKDSKFGNRESFSANLVADLPTPLVISSEFRPEAKSINSLDLYVDVGNEGARFLFRGVPITDDSPKSLSDKARVDYNGISIAFESCHVVSGTLTCNFTAVSSGKDSRTDEGYCIGCRSPRIVDSLANEYSVDKVIYGNKENTRELVANIPTPVRVISRDFSSEATEVALLEIRFQDTIIYFRNLPIGSENNLTSYKVSKDNIAYKKLVSIDTNGADDDGKSCRSPGEITDGSLLLRSNNCLADGIVGFQNNDYNELMEVTVKIDLQQTYNITKIRYNQGNVQRAETWNADSMITPFGKIRTLSGSSNKGAWTEQTGSTTTTILEIKFQKTRTKYANDWLYIGEIEVIGTLVKDKSTNTQEPTKPNLDEYKTPDPTLAKLIQDEMRQRGNINVEIEVFKSNTSKVKINVKGGSLSVEKTNAMIQEIVKRRKIQADIYFFRQMEINGQIYWVRII